MTLHLRILWGLVDPKQVPQDPSDQILATFASCFTTEASLYECREGPMRIAPTLVQIGSSVSITDHGQIAAQILLVEEHMLEYMQACLARFGLTSWCPDLRQTPYALYNAACRVIALDTFKQALVSHTYAHLKPNTTYAREMELLIRLYDHVVHHYMYLRYRRDSRNPGCVTAADKASPQYRGRARVCAFLCTSAQLLT
jgi:hypothetical protein